MDWLPFAPDLRECPFCAHAERIVIDIPINPPAFTVACPESGARGPKQLPGADRLVAMSAWNRRFATDPATNEPPVEDQPKYLT